MRRKIRFISLFLSLLVLLSLTTEIVRAVPIAVDGDHEKAGWTVMLYMSGDNELEDYITLDLETELAPAGSNKDVQIVALADRIPGLDKSAGNWTSTKLFHVTKGMTATADNAVADWGERNFGDPQTLIDFVTWTKTNYPADRYALVFWGHGWSWHTDFTMWDDTDQDALDPDEIKAALPSLGIMDVVAYDGCNTGAIEIQAMWRGHAQALSHSEEFVGLDGLEYEKVIPELQANPEMSADELAVVFTESAKGNHEQTWSAVALDDRWDALEEAVNEWAVALIKGLPKNRANYDKAFRATRSFWQDPASLDLYDAASQIKTGVKDPNIRAKSQAVMGAVNAVVLDEWHVRKYKDVHGIAIFIPTRLSHLDHPDTTVFDADYYHSQLDFAKDTRWDEFLAAYLNFKYKH